MKVHTTPKGERFECQQQAAVDILNRKVEKLDKCVFFGNGKPSLTTQMATLQQSQAAVCRVAWITLAAVIGQLVYLFFDKFSK
jgi:hypothetical protein